MMRFGDTIERFKDKQIAAKGIFQILCALVTSTLLKPGTGLAEHDNKLMTLLNLSYCNTCSAVIPLY